jgi:hypothetical protein
MCETGRGSAFVFDTSGGFDPNNARKRLTSSLEVIYFYAVYLTAFDRAAQEV